MSVQLNELLKLDILSTFKVIAGFDGLVRNVCKVGILDHELGEHIDTNFIEGEFVLTNLLFIKDDIDQLEDIVRRLIRSKTGGLAIKPLYIDSIPEQVLKIADENEYPIFMYDTVYYEDIITELVNYIRKSDELHDQLVYVNDLKDESLRPEEVQKLGYRLNPDFKNWIVTACITLEQNSGETLFSPYNGNQILGKHHKCYIDEDRIYMFFSFDEAINDESVTMNLIEATGIESSTSVGGLSSIKPIAKLNESLIEASHARQYCEIFDKKSIISFNKLGMYQMLMPLKMNPWMKSYYSRIITPLEEYDLKNGSELIKTAQIYINTGCDVKLTAEALYQHGNTIRYRLDRIKSILEGVVDKTLVDQELAVAIRLHMLHGDQ